MHGGNSYNIINGYDDNDDFHTLDRLFATWPKARRTNQVSWRGQQCVWWSDNIPDNVYSAGLLSICRNIINHPTEIESLK